MPRSRNIKPAFFKNEHLAELPFESRLLFIGLWTLADKSGRLEDRPKRIKIELFPGDDVDIDSILDQLADSDGDFIQRYSVENKKIIQVNNWERHQNPHHQEKASELPEYSESNEIVRANARTDSNQGANKTNTGSESVLLIPDPLFQNSDSLNTDILKPESDKSQSRCISDIDCVVNYYQKYHPRSKPDKKVRGKIKDRFEDGYSVDDLFDAIDGCHISPFHSGVNDSGSKHQTL